MFPQNTKASCELTKMIEEFKGRPFAIIFMPGAGAPIQNLDNWMSAGLGGCTGESIELCKQNGRFNYIVINSMTPEEQKAAHANILASKGVDLSSQKTINDPGCTLRQVFAKNGEMTKTVDGRMAYLPRAYIFGRDEKLHKCYGNDPTEPGKPRAAQPYVATIAMDVLTLAVSLYTRDTHSAPSISNPGINPEHDRLNERNDAHSPLKRNI